ncbi:MAG: family 10 glycosylhydrolase [Phycisphaerae bacterium]|nr:family 10 glycosylhydrolase [Phycisphaerae bacterium]
MSKRPSFSWDGVARRSSRAPRTVLIPRAVGTVLMVLLLAASTTPRAALADEEFRGFWADAFGIGFKSQSEIDTMVARAVTGNYNAIVAEVLAYQDTSTSNNGHGAYWKSSILPWASVVSTNFDPLEYLCQEAHANGIEVHAWLVAYRVSTTWPPYGNSLLASHPEWLMVPSAGMGGGPATIDDKYTLDPGSPDVQEHLVGIVRELVTNYDVDGIHFDYIRYTDKDAGYPADLTYEKSSLARYQAITGTTSTPGYTNGDWSDFRRRTIDELIRRCRAEIPSITSNPRQPVQLTAALFASGGAPADFTDSDAYYLHQNWKHWMDMGWLDAACPMNYKDERNSTHATWYRSWIDASVAWRADRHVYCGQGNYLNAKADSITQMLYVYNAGADGSMNYAYRSTADENNDEDPEADWTWYTYVASNLFTSPAALPTMPWRDPATATEGTLWGQVTDYLTGEPIDNALVIIGGTDTVYTDGNGYYVATLLSASAAGTSYSATATAAGFPNMTRSEDVIAGDVVRLDFPLGEIMGDWNGDGVVDILDMPMFKFCMSGPQPPTSPPVCRTVFDFDADLDIDMADFAQMQLPPLIDVDDIVLESRDASGTLTPSPAYVEDGAWANSTAKSTVPELVGSGGRFISYVLPNTGTDNATFVPEIVTSGVYEVYVTWGTGANCYDAQYTINHGSNQTVLLVDQIPTGVTGANDNTWVSLGQYWFPVGQDNATCSINVSEETVSGKPHSGWNQRVYADGLKLVFISRW